MVSEGASDPGRDAAAEAALLARWQDGGDVDALDALLRGEVARIAAQLRARARGGFDGATSASDLAQEAVLRLLRLEETPRFDDPNALRGYLWTAAWRLFQNHAAAPARAVRRLTATESRTLSGMFAVTGGFGALAAEEQRTALEVVVNLLDPIDRDALSAVYFEGLSIEEAARRAGVTRGTFDVRLLRARQRLATRLVDWSDVIP
ncbi:MAG: RNA polymerase sigma factor [Planctomycetes bacterium]|nr:RNA polymerase sigma factor [Planctomycetota bacterium]